ncbi:FAD-dependent oxidoreductase [Nonomuraea sp. C10]|uniref:FAD-dependent oxidoreductase n=1 Tax=Nonomuraea sp. C10 TaxID=2600577 RepID=UPI0011CE2F2C|nr:FAD-dependent oxidoreductase [Nonomuraea sp. C10]TXK40847.1 methyltransferase domain-containing protein [Nonomuraea sp. C10]
MSRTYEVVVVGGGVAGLSGAVTLARARRTVLVVDSGRSREEPAIPGVGREEVARYGGEVVDGTVTEVGRVDGGFRVALAGGSSVVARRLLVATGVSEELPGVPGLAGRWGRDVVHCPDRHGWEMRDRRVAVLATGPIAAHQALTWRQWSADVTLFLHTAPEPAGEEYERLAARDIALVNGKVTGLEVTGDALTGVTMADGRVIACEVLVVAPRASARAGFLAGLGLETEEQRVAGVPAGVRLAADAAGATGVPGVWAAGGVTDVTETALGAAAAGARAARAVNADLIAEEARHAAETRPVPFSAEAERGVSEGVQKRRLHNRYAADQEMSGQQWWDARYSGSTRVWSGRPNMILSREVPALTPGTALDLGCGEGGDAIWLAGQGWRVTAADISGVALERAARFAAEAGVADAIDFQRHDFGASFPAGSYDLVSAHYLHSYQDLPRERILRAAAGAVAPGGVLLIVGHAGWPSWQDDHPDVHLPTAREVLDSLELAEGEWEVELCEEFERAQDAPDGTPGTRTDNVLKIRRLDPGR